MDIISRVKALHLPVGEYLVFGSGVMEINGIRPAKDVDLLITDELYRQLRTQGWRRKWNHKRVLTCKALKKGDSEAFTNLYWKAYQFHTKDLIAKAEMIDGVPFMSLKDYLFYKQHLPRDKDKQDVLLMQNYLTQQTTKAII